MDSELLRAEVRNTLAGFVSVNPDDDSSRRYVSIKPLERFPVPELVLFALRDGAGLKDMGAGEKTRWSIWFEYKGARFGVELRKFGFTFLAEAEHPPDTSRLTKEVLGRLSKAVQIVENHLEQLAAVQAQEGRVTVANRFHYLERMYQFFRDEAKRTYQTPPPAPGPEGYWPYKFQEQASYLAHAMMSAYFSRCEHVLVLALAFTGFDPAGGKLQSFLNASWSTKMRDRFNLNADLDAQRLFEKLKRVRDRLRNPLAHGGFEAGRGSLYFHLPGVGALPARMTRHKDGYDFDFIPILATSFEETCTIFDEFDRFLRARMEAGWMWAESGLDVDFGESSRRAYAEALQGDFAAFIEQRTRIWEYHVNFEY